MATNSANNISQIVISVDLKQAIKEYLSCIKEYNDHPEYQQKQAREYAIYRYEAFWLPLLAENVGLDLVPPLDVHFVWICHMLAPVSYSNDCERMFGQPLPGSVSSRNSQIIKFSEQIWLKKFGRAMPYNLNYNTNIQVIPPYTSKIKYPLSKFVEEQVNFYYNVSFGHFKDPKFINDAIERYKKLLNLKRINKQLLIVPMFDIDLVWHTHQLHSEAYRRDMMHNVQQVIQNDYSLTDRTTNAKVISSDHETRHKWFELYGDRLPKNGCMYRGKSSRDFYQKMTDFKFLWECQRYTIYVQFRENLSSTALEKQNSRREPRNTASSSNNSSRDSLRDQIFAQINSSDQELFLRGGSGHVESHFEADFEDFDEELVLKIQQKAGIWPLNYYSTIEEIKIPSDRITAIRRYEEPIEPTQTNEDDSNSLYYLFDMKIESSSRLRTIYPQAKRLVAGVSASDINSVIVRLEASDYETITLNESYSTQIGTSFLFNLENLSIQQALHKIIPVHQEGPAMMNIRHSIINDIHVFTATINGSIFATSHTLNWSQLPLPSQVSINHENSVITLDPEKEEALIIKDHQGDWGIVKFNRDLFTPSEDKQADPKHSQIIVYHFLPNGDIEEEIIHVDWENDAWLISSDNITIDMNRWTVSFNRKHMADAAQYICLGASLITRFDVILSEIFGSEENEDQDENDGQDLLANDFNEINFNRSNALEKPSAFTPKRGKNTSNQSSV